MTSWTLLRFSRIPIYRRLSAHSGEVEAVQYWQVSWVGFKN